MTYRPAPEARLQLRMSVSMGSGAVTWLGLALSGAVAIAWAVERLAPDSEVVRAAAPEGLPLAAAVVVAAGSLPLGRPARWHDVSAAMRWGGLLLMLWAANGLPFDLLTMLGLIGHRTADGAVVMDTVYWPGLVMRTFALVTAVVLARRLLALPASPAFTRPSTWYGYVAFVLALPYPVLRVHWASGGTLGLQWAGAAGTGWEPLLIAIPWLMAACLSLLLASPPRWIPRRLLLAGGWSASAVVAMIGPGAVWALISISASGGAPDTEGVEPWVFGLFYGSWLLWAIAAAAATRSLQVRSAALRSASPTRAPRGS